MTPVVKWVGSKRWLAERMRDMVVERCRRRYFEPFLGSGAVALALPTTIPVVASDLESDIVECYEQIRYKPLSVLRHLDHLRLTHSKEAYYAVRGDVPLWASERAARVLYLNRMGFNGLFRKNRSGRFNVPLGRGKVTSLPGVVALFGFARQTQNWRLSTCDFEETIALARDGDFVFSDPPYVGTFDYSSGFSIADQIRLRRAMDAAHDRGASVATTNSSLARELYEGGDWTIEEISETRRVAADAGRRAAAPCLLMTRLR